MPDAPIDDELLCWAVRRSPSVGDPARGSASGSGSNRRPRRAAVSLRPSTPPAHVEPTAATLTDSHLARRRLVG